MLGGYKVIKITGVGLGALLGLMLMLGQLVLPTPVSAQDDDHNNCASSQLPWRMTMAARLVDTLPIGSVIPGSQAERVIDINCDEGWFTTDTEMTCIDGPNWAFHTVSGAQIQETSVPGVFTFGGLPDYLGYQFLDAGGQPLPLDASNRHNTGVRITTGQQSVLASFRLVKLSNTLPASGSPQLAMTLSCSGQEWANRNSRRSQVILTVDIQRITQTCRMTTPSVQVVLPTISLLDFHGVGSAAGNVPFTLNFECDANARALARISDASMLTNDGEILTLQGSSTADGVGVRLSHQGQAVRLSPNGVFDQPGSEFPLNSPDSVQTINLALSAEYVQTQATLVPGTVQALAIVTIAYE